MPRDNGDYFDHFTTQRGSDSPADLIFRNVTGYCVASSANTPGGALRVSATGSIQSCSGAR
ncbi:hypothetical protein ACRYCC_34420 [Actinomadura scrupuli]|uniref:hypothetical protein n=1 Tax=Actinomadura scrupuli TaxID=559629 RepID=UPI003D9621F6